MLFQQGQRRGLPKDSKVAWISTRRGSPAAEHIAGHLHSNYLLHDMMRSVTAPLDELSTAHAVVLEAPSIAMQRFEHDMLNLINKITSQCPNLAVIVQPSLRRKSNKTLWISRWNRLHKAPFKFQQTCSCKVGDAVPGCHMALLIGTTKDINMSPCAEVPTLSATPEAVVRNLGGTLFTLSASLLAGYRDVGRVQASLVSATPTLRRLTTAGDSRGWPASAGDSHGWPAPVGSQRTPDSALNPQSRADGSALTLGADHDSAPSSTVREVMRPNSLSTAAYPTDSKVREKQRRQAEKDAGIERVVKKRK